MKTKSVPAIITLLACFVACVAGIAAHMDVWDSMKMLLLVLVLFYILGCIVQWILDKNFPVNQDEETTEGEAGPTDGEASEGEADDEEAAGGEEDEE